jgi:hypothetical protein
LANAYFAALALQHVLEHRALVVACDLAVDLIGDAHLLEKTLESRPLDPTEHDAVHRQQRALERVGVGEIGRGAAARTATPIPIRPRAARSFSILPALANSSRTAGVAAGRRHVRRPRCACGLAAPC